MEIFDCSKNNLLSSVGKVDRNVILSQDAEGYLCFGPYISLPKGSYRASYSLMTGSNASGDVTMDVCYGNGTHVAAKTIFNLNTLEIETELSIDFDFDEPRDTVEIRLHVSATASLAVTSLKISWRKNKI